ncbi:MAG: hypothetical protein AAF564_18715 [Bacteroidota bacterium]
MQISKGILLLPLLLIFCLLFGFTAQERGPAVQPQSSPVMLDAGAPPVMGVLLLRLQVIQAELDHDERPVPTALKDSLFDLSLGLRKSFDGALGTDFDQLTIAQQQIHTEVWKLVLALDVMMVSDVPELRAV